MNDNAKKWVEALRSNEFEQAHDQLMDVIDPNGKVGYCCLGVACELHRRETGNGEWVNGVFVIGDEQSQTVLPGVVQDWLGLAHPDGDYEEGDYSLAVKNDSGLSFNQIADIIESSPAGLFAE